MSQRLSTDLKRIRHLPEGPLKAVRLSLWWLRKTFFTKPKPDNPAVFVRLTNQELVELLGREYFEPGWELSYSYRNETLNLRRVEYVAAHPLGYEWWQVHLRGYLHEAGSRFEEDTFELAAHFEVEPTEYPSAHIQGGRPRDRTRNRSTDRRTRRPRRRVRVPASRRPAGQPRQRTDGSLTTSFELSNPSATITVIRYLSFIVRPSATSNVP